MKKILMVLYCLYVLPQVFSQDFRMLQSPPAMSPGYTDIKSVGHGSSGMAMATNTSSWGSGMSDMMLVRLDNNQDILWQRCYGSGYQEYCRAFDTLLNGDYILAGHNNHGNILLLRIRPTSDTVWTRLLSTTTSDIVCDIKRYDSTSFLICGTRADMMTGGVQKMFVARIRNNGLVLWAREFQNSDHFEVSQLLVKNDYIHLLGHSNVPPNKSVSLVKLDSAANIVWQYKYSVPYYNNFTQSLLSMPDGDLCFSGYFEDYATGDSKSFYTRVDSMGTVVWSRQFMEVPGNYNYLNACNLVPGAGGNLLACGFYSDSVTGGTQPVKFLCTGLSSETGDILWSWVYRLNESPQALSYLSTAVPRPSGIVWLGNNRNLAALSTVGNFFEPVLMTTDLNGYTSCNINQYPEFPYAHFTWTISVTGFVPQDFIFTVSASRLQIKNPVMSDSAFCVLSGLDEIKEADCLSLYPNPSAGRFTLEACAGISRIEMYDVNGHCVWNSKANSTQITMENLSLSKGIYCVKAETARGLFIRKLIVE